jgi:hypothetical protein
MPMPWHCVSALVRLGAAGLPAPAPPAPRSTANHNGFMQLTSGPTLCCGHQIGLAFYCDPYGIG